VEIIEDEQQTATHRPAPWVLNNPDHDARPEGGNP
jgi:hypothetical protein